jgi:hypothetical protein
LVALFLAAFDGKKADLYSGILYGTGLGSAGWGRVRPVPRHRPQAGFLEGTDWDWSQKT